MREIRTHAGTQFDPDLVELFCAVFAKLQVSADPAQLPALFAGDADGIESHESRASHIGPAEESPRAASA